MMRWYEARLTLEEMLNELGKDWSPAYRESVRIAIERIKEVEDLQDDKDP